MGEATKFLSKTVYLFVAVFLLLVASGCGREQATQTPPSTTGTIALNFADEERLQEHWQKHGSEFGPGITEQQYLEKARAFFANNSSDKLLKHRANGDELHYLPSSNEFGVLREDRVIRTYFRPDTGRAYWERQ